MQNLNSFFNFDASARLQQAASSGFFAQKLCTGEARPGKKWPRRVESNHQLTLRRGLLYPFNYGEGGGTRVPDDKAYLWSEAPLCESRILASEQKQFVAPYEGCAQGRGCWIASIPHSWTGAKGFYADALYMIAEIS